MITSIQKMQSNDLFRSSTPSFSEAFPNDMQSQLSMLYAIAQQQLASSASASSSDSKVKRFKKSNDLPTQVPFISATDSSINEREVVKVVTTAGPQSVDKEFLNQLLTRKDVIPARKRRDFIPNDLKDEHYWERRRKNNLAAKRSREKRRLNDIVLETKVVELTNENETLKAKLQLMLSRLNMKETDMESLFEEEQRLGHICLKPTTSAATILGQHDDHDEHLTMSSSETHDEDEPIPRYQHESAVDLTRSEVKTGNLLTTTTTTKSPSPLTPSPSPPHESLLQILANQMIKNKQETTSNSRLLTIASPTNEKKATIVKNDDNNNDDDQQQKWDEAAMTLLSLNKPPPPAPAAPSVRTPVEQQVALQSVINGLLRKPNPPKATIDYHSHAQAQQIQGENFHFDQWKTLMNYFSMPSTQQSSVPSNFSLPSSQPSSTHESTRADMMPLKLRMKMLNARN